MSHKVDDEQRYLKQQSTPSATTSSPTHEFSFTTLQPPPPPPPPPADDIFFHGHLLPLHPIPDSPRTSNNSLDSFTLPINLLFGNTSFHCHHETVLSDSDITTINPNRPKSKSFSIFGIPKWNKRSDNNDIQTDDYECQVKDKNIRQLIKRYMKMVKTLLFLPKRSNNHQSYSLSGNSVRRKTVEMSKRRGQLSAPASMRASPANSGILVASGCASPTKIRSESSMEELHAAIQAAIAHCKNSIAMDPRQN